jgi:adenine deaminase
MKNNRQAVDGDDLFGCRAFQIAKSCQILQFTFLDRPGRRGEVGVGLLEGSESGAGAVGGDIDCDSLAFGGLPDDALLVVAAG